MSIWYVRRAWMSSTWCNGFEEEDDTEICIYIHINVEYIRFYYRQCRVERVMQWNGIQNYTACTTPEGNYFALDFCVCLCAFMLPLISLSSILVVSHYYLLRMRLRGVKKLDRAILDLKLRYLSSILNKIEWVESVDTLRKLELPHSMKLRQISSRLETKILMFDWSILGKADRLVPWRNCNSNKWYELMHVKQMMSSD